MKLFFFFCLLLCFGGPGYPQGSTSKIYHSDAPQRLEVACNKTTSLIFPFAIRMVDRGSPEVIVQIPPAADSILLVKANRENFHQTNLTVVTADGEIHCFLVDYAANPDECTLHFASDHINTATEERFSPSVTEREFLEQANRLHFGRTVGYGCTDHHHQMCLRVRGFFIRHDLLYCGLEIQNRSHIGYEVERIRFFMEDKHPLKHSARQQIDWVPLYQTGKEWAIASGGSLMPVFGFSKQTLPDRKNLCVEVTEKQGGRNLKCMVHHRAILRATVR